MSILITVAKVLLTIFFSLRFLDAVLEYEEKGLWCLFWATVNMVLMIVLVKGG